MITVTKEAAEQIRVSSKETNAEGLPLRLAATKDENGVIEYGMGFDSNHTDSDNTFTCEGIEFVVSQNSASLISGATLDFGEVEPGHHNFIFNNPNDPKHGKPVNS